MVARGQPLLLLDSPPRVCVPRVGGDFLGWAFGVWTAVATAGCHQLCRYAGAGCDDRSGHSPDESFEATDDRSARIAHRDPGVVAATTG